MKFGKDFRIRTLQEKTLPDWRDKFLSYKRLKELVTHLPPTTTAVAADSLPHNLNSQQQPSDANTAGGSCEDANFQPNTYALVH